MPTVRLAAPAAPSPLAHRAAGPLVALALTALALAAGGLVGGPTTAAAQATLEGTPWRLVSYAGPGGQLVRVLPATELTATFRGGRVTGETGCNTFTAAYQVTGNALQISQAATTLRACLDSAVAQQEAAYLQALGRVASYALSGDNLTLRDAAGGALLVYVPQPQAALEGTDWVADSYNNGREAVVSLVAGTEITARFVGGRLSGSAGCNTYTAGYTLAGAALTIQPPASTRRACSSPPGVMEQETAYLAALPTTQRYRIEGDRLTLERNDGARVATYVARTVRGPAGLPRTGTGPGPKPSAPAWGAFAAPAALGLLALAATAWRHRRAAPPAGVGLMSRQ